MTTPLSQTEPPEFAPEELIQCTYCHWAGPAEQRHLGATQCLHCPACNRTEFERLP